MSNTLNRENILSKRMCINTKDKCNVGFKPYSYLELEKRDPKTNKYYTDDEKIAIKTRFKERCGNEVDSQESFCCDPLDTNIGSKLTNISSEFKSKFRKIVVDKCNNKINSIKVCDDDNTNCKSPNDRPKKASPYELCKLQNVVDADIEEDGNIKLDKLMPDCYEGKCEGVGKLLELYPDNLNEKITNHYYLIDAVKNNNLSYIKSYFSTQSRNNINEKLEYGYPGNTILHQAIFDEVNDIVNYIVTLNVDLTLVNKDGNSVLHIACLKGNYNAVHQLIKLGVSINCKNNIGDTALHCAVRSGSYNTVLILLNNGATAALETMNEHDETSLHTAVVSKKKNLKIVEILVEYGAKVHSKNKYGETVLASLLKEDKTVVRETIRTFLQRSYYYKYKEGDYNKMLRDYPEVRPFEVDTEISDELSKNYNEYDDQINYKELIQYDDAYVSDKGLYLDKDTIPFKAHIDEKYFDDDKVSQNNVSNDSDLNGDVNDNNYEIKEEIEFTEELLDNIESFTNSKPPTNSNNKNVANSNIAALNKRFASHFDTKLMVASFVSLLALILLLIVIYTKRV